MLGADTTADGKGLGFWVAGHNVYGASVIVANLVILHRFNNFTGYGEFTVFLMILAYYLFMVIESYTGMFPVLSHVAGTMFSSVNIWASIIGVSMIVSAGELAMRSWNKVYSQ